MAVFIALIVLAAVLGEFALAVGVGKMLAGSSAATFPVATLITVPRTELRERV